MRIDGKIVALRDLQTKDLDSLKYWMNPSHKWHETNGPYYPPTTEKEIPQVIEKCAKEIALGELPEMREYLAIVDRASDKFIGKTNRYWISQETNWLAIGILVYDPSNWQGGVGTEALQLWCNYLFDADKTLARIDLRTWSGNPGMMRLAEKVGFKQEAVFRKARIVKGEYYDGLGYGILREEWKSDKK